MPEPDSRVRGLGDFLVEGHNWLRKELNDLRRQLDDLEAGTGENTLTRLSPELAQQLRQHCLEFCGALEEHHTGEDRGAFPMLAAQHPELGPELTVLGEEHKAVAVLQQEIAQLVRDHVPGVTDPARLRTRLRQLADDLERHFEYEERTVVELLNRLGPAPGSP